MTNAADKRMLWLRNVDTVAAAKASHTLEVEVGSDLQIPGLLTYGAGDAILFGPATYEPDASGLFKYVLRLRQAEQREFNVVAAGKAFDTGEHEEGYLVPDGEIGELLALFSLCLQARFFVLSTSTRGLTMHDLPMKHEREPLRVRGGPHLDGVVFTPRDDRNLSSSILPFLTQIQRLPAERHLETAIAAVHYARALRTIGLDEELVFVRLVSAVERLSHDQRIVDDRFSGKALDDLMRLDQIDVDDQKELRKVFRVRRAKARFVAFLQEYAADFFAAEPQEPELTDLTQVTMASLPRIAGAIYDARSGYLHNGDPMYLSRRARQFPQWHMEPSGGMIWQDRVFTGKQKLPTAEFFHRLVRHCILARLKELGGHIEGADAKTNPSR